MLESEPPPPFLYFARPPPLRSGRPCPCLGIKMRTRNARIPKSSSWPRTKTVVKKWLNMKDAEFHSDCIGGWLVESSENLRPRNKTTGCTNMEQMVQEDLQVFKNLPALLCLKILVKEPLQETLTISCSGFQYLREFCSYPSDYELGLTYLKNKKNVLSVMFETGAMPKLERLKFGFYAHDALSAYGVGFDFGIHHLTSLKHLSVHINCRGAKAWEVEATQAAIRSAAALLPNHRTPDIRLYGEANMAKDEDQREDADGANVPEKQDGTK